METSCPQGGAIYNSARLAGCGERGWAQIEEKNIHERYQNLVEEVKNLVKQGNKREAHVKTLEEVEPVAKELEESLQKNMLAHRSLLLNVEDKAIQLAASATRIIIINLVFIITTIIVIIVGITISFFVSRSFPKE